jgi:hypothetical protein
MPVNVRNTVNVGDAVLDDDAVNVSEAVNVRDAVIVGDDVIVDNCDVATVGDGNITLVNTVKLQSVQLAFKQAVIHHMAYYVLLPVSAISVIDTIAVSGGSVYA